MTDSPPLPASARSLAAQAERHETPCGSGRIVWHAWGAPAGRPLVLFHGGSGSWTHWLHAIAPLAAAGWRVWAPDLPGFGDSDLPPDGDDADAMPVPLEAGLSQLLGDTPVTLVGFSFGGMVGGMLAARFPARVRRLVLVGAPALGVVERGGVPLRGWRHLATDAERDAVHRHNLGVLMLRGDVDDEALALHRANVVRGRLPRRRLAYTRALADALLQVRCPVDAIYGEHDAIYIGHAAALTTALQQSARRFGQLRWIAGAGHWVQHERPEAFNAALAQLLAEPAAG